MKEETQKLELHRDFPVDRDTVYQAWTEEAALRQWWRPLGHELDHVANEIREGGRVAYTFQGGKLQIEGEYREARPAERLVYTWNWKMKDEPVHDAAYLLTVEFAEHGEGSRLHVLQDQFATEEAIQPHREGWESALESLGSYLKRQG